MGEKAALEREIEKLKEEVHVYRWRMLVARQMCSWLWHSDAELICTLTCRTESCRTRLMIFRVTWTTRQGTWTRQSELKLVSGLVLFFKSTVDHAFWVWAEPVNSGQLD